MQVWRLFPERFRSTAFTGVGSLYTAGRWNHLETAMVYTATSRALAALEFFVNLQPNEAPNDLLMGGKKFCGILTEMHAEPDRVHFLVVGVGVDVNHAKMPAELAEIATSLRMATGKPQFFDTADPDAMLPPALEAEWTTEGARLPPAPALRPLPAPKPHRIVVKAVNWLGDLVTAAAGPGWAQLSRSPAWSTKPPPATSAGTSTRTQPRRNMSLKRIATNSRTPITL